MRVLLRGNELLVLDRSKVVARALIEVLILHRRLPMEAMRIGITVAVSAGSVSPTGHRRPRGSQNRHQ
ncbi:hypothetical protein AB0I02_08780 [Streptomyces phaeochromogenes]